MWVGYIYRRSLHFPFRSSLKTRVRFVLSVLSCPSERVMHSVLQAHFEVRKFYLRCTHMEMDGRMGGGGGGGGGGGAAAAAATALVVVSRKLKERIETVSYI